MNTAEPVVIVHGLWVHGLIMRWLARRMVRCGYTVHVYSYPSMRLTLTQNAKRLAQFCSDLAVPRLHLIGHSLGGLIALKMLESAHAVSCGRLLLLGTPYTGSFAAQRLARYPGGHALLGRSVAEWLHTPRPVPAGVTEIGVIAGTRGIGLGRLVAPDLPRPNDGVVALTETEVPGVVTRLALPVSHSEMLVSREVARQCCAFLGEGRFVPATAP